MQRFQKHAKSIFIFCLFFCFSFFFSCQLVKAISYYGVANAVARIRTGPGTNHGIITQTSLGATYDMDNTNKYPDEGGCASGWYQIRYQGSSAYVCSDYLDIYQKGNGGDTGVPETDCEKDLANKGFPSSYWNGLCALKSQHPNWNFEAKKTGVDFSSAVSAESSCGVNLMSTSNDNYINYKCGTTNYNGYKTVSSGVVSYFLDPRNFFNNTNIFMFEAQYYNGNISDGNYLNAIVKIFGSTNFLLNQIPDLPTYILNASKELGVNPISIASRVKQELGTGKANSGPYAGQLQSALSGNYYDRFGLYNGKNFNNYYNFFNVGAYDSCTGMTECALTYAYNNNWGGPQYNQAQGRQVAMTGGARFIKNRYIDVGQNSVYLHKFNVNPTDASRRYLNQYMSNIQAPQSESSLMYSAYNSLGMIHSSFNFYIPVFENMPSSTHLPTNSNDKDYTGQDTPIDPNPDDGNGGSEEQKMNVNNIIAAAGLKRDGSYLTGIAIKANVADIKSRLEGYNASVEIQNANGAVVTSGIMGTGFKVTIRAANTETLEVIIYGDTSGDGLINALDLLRIQKNILGTSSLSGAQKLAADPSRDGKINALDLLKVQKYILGSGTINQ